jgi:IclR family transcriptional regulator, acetate operon repressor
LFHDLGSNLMTTSTADGTAALDKALDVLDAIGQAPQGLSQLEITQQLGLPRTTTYRLLGSLVNRQLIRRDPTKRVYRLGMRCFEYARQAYAMPDLVAAASSELRSLRDLTGETVYLAALDGHEVVALERCDGVHSQRSSSAIGQRKPLHSTSQGKAILAAMDDAQREQLVREIQLPACTALTITDRRRLLAELRLTSSRGWSIDDEEQVLGVRCCGAAIVDAQGQVRGSVSVASPKFRMTHERLALLGPEVVAAAKRIAAQLPALRQPTQDDLQQVQPITTGWTFSGRFPLLDHVSRCLVWADTLAPAIHTTCLNHPGQSHSVGLEQPIIAMVSWHGGFAVLKESGWRFLLRKTLAANVPIPASASHEHMGTGCASLAQLDEWPEDIPALPKGKFSAATTDASNRLWACYQQADTWLLGVTEPYGQHFVSQWKLDEPATSLCFSQTHNSVALGCAGSGSVYWASVGQRLLRRLATVPKGSGQISGLATDPQGGIWCSLRGGWSLMRLEADGAIDRVIALPVPDPLDLLWDNRDQTLIVTTGRSALSREALDAAPWSGRLLRVKA